MAKKYQEVRETHRIGSEDYLWGSLGDIRDKIQDLIQKYGDEAYLEVQTEGEMGYDHDIDVYTNIDVIETRLETDHERDKRLADAKRRREAGKKAAATRKVTQDEYDRKLYDKLKKKFEDEK